MGIFDAFGTALQALWHDSGFYSLTMGNVIMMLVGCILMYMAFAKEFEPLLLGPISFGCVIANFPVTHMLDEPGAMQLISYGIKYEVFPPLIFMGVGAMTDFGPLLANPNTILLGAAAQFGVFIALFGAMALGFTPGRLPLSVSSAALMARPLSTWPPRWLRSSWALSPLPLTPICLSFP